MGLDGGTIISRNDVLRGQCWELNKADDSRSTRGGAVRGVHKRKQLNINTSKVTRWSTCAVSGEPLAAPVVACFLGRLYNKAAVLELLLARAGRFADEQAEHRYLNQLRTAGDAFDHITSMQDVFALQYSSAAAADGAAAAVSADTADGGADPELPAPYTCPLTHLRCDRHPFVALRPCGHVFSERALREVGGDGTCPTCGAAFLAEEDAIPLLPGEEQLERLRELLPTRRKQQKQQKKKKRKHREAAADEAAAGKAAADKADLQPGQQQQENEEKQQQQQQPPKR